MTAPFLARPLPAPLQPLEELALDLRWTWSHEGDAFWRRIDPRVWDGTRNPWMLLQDVTGSRLRELAEDPRFRADLAATVKRWRRKRRQQSFFERTRAEKERPLTAFFCMEYALGEALPLYAGGLGILAGDFLKTACDLGVPMVGVGLLYQQGYLHQVLEPDGGQREVYPYNDPASLPIQPVDCAEGGWLHVPLELPGRRLLLRVWRANVGCVPLFLLDSNDPLNSAADRGITDRLYGSGDEPRFLQALVLGVGGWRALERMGLNPEVCHINEGHAAFAVVERARSYGERAGLEFHEALWATRPGNHFTTHTPLAAGFDSFPAGLLERYQVAFSSTARQPAPTAADLLQLGRRDPRDSGEPFCPAFLAVRASGSANAVSRAHGETSRALFSGLYPRWPVRDVPIGHVTNGVHFPSWDSEWADEIWTAAGGKERWRSPAESLSESVALLPDALLWTQRGRARNALVEHARLRLARSLGHRGAPAERLEEALSVLDPDVLTLGFARRFTAYKRPNLLLEDEARLKRLLSDPVHPIQIVLAGKAHPDDVAAKQMIRDWIRFLSQPGVRRRVVFLEDYDIDLAATLVQGVDVWLNAPAHPWEACGTSGMKVLVNGGLDISTAEGWWAEAYRPDAGWLLPDDGFRAAGPTVATALYDLLETKVLPEFYARGEDGIPHDWVARIRKSLSLLAPQFSSNRMLLEYVDTYYGPAAAGLRKRTNRKGSLARRLRLHSEVLRRSWPTVHFGTLDHTEEDGKHRFRAEVFLGELHPDMVAVELYAEPNVQQDGHAEVVAMRRGDAIPGAPGGAYYTAELPASRPAEDYTPRVIPRKRDLAVPAEAPLICWRDA